MQVDKEELVSYWMEQVKLALQWKKQVSGEDQWLEQRKMYRGSWAEGVIPLNITFSSTRTLVPRVYYSDPRVLVQPTHPSLEYSARVVEAIDNWLIREAMLKQTLRTGCLHTLLNGIGPIKLGFDSEFGYIGDQAVDPSGQTATQFAEKQSRYIEYNTAIKPGMPWALPDVPDNIIIPEGYKYQNQLPWIGHRVLRPLEDVLSDSKYTISKELQGTKISDLDIKVPLGRVGKDAGIAVCELIEIRDASTRTIMTFCEDQLILSDHDVLQIEGLPWELLVFNEDPEHIWGISDVKQITAQQLEVNEIKTQTQAHRAITLLKFLTLKGALKPFDIKGLLSGDVGPYVEVENVDAISQAISILQPHIPPDLYTASREVVNDIQETLRTGPNQMAAFKAGTPPTAQETAEVGGSHMIDVDDRRDIVGDAFVRIIRKWNQMIFTLWKKEKVIQVVGPEGIEWIEYTGDQIKGEYLYKVDPDTGFKVSRQVRMQAADKLLAQFGGDPNLNIMEMKQMVLREYEWIFPGISRILMSQLPPEITQAQGEMRQPHPQGAAQGTGESIKPPTSDGNRGGGRQPGKVIPFEQANKGVR